MATVDSPSDLFAEDADGRTGWHGWWILFVSLVIQSSGYWLSVQDWISAQLQTPEFRIGAGPPLYFIHGDALQGISAAFGLVGVFIFTAFTWSYSRVYSHMAQWMAILWMSPHVAIAIDIWIRCENLFSRQATCPWLTIESYLDDPRRMIAQYGTMALAGLYCFGGSWFFYRRGRSQHGAIATSEDNASV